MRVWPTFILLVLFAQSSDDPMVVVRNIPKRYREDWRLFCNVCNHFIWTVHDKLNKSIQVGDEHDFESRVGFRLDSNGKKHNLKQKSIDVTRSEIKITEVMDEDICKSMKVDAVLYNRTSKRKEGVRMLQKDQLFNKTSDLRFTKRRKYVAKANLYCAEIYQRFYDEVIEAFTSENLSSRDSFCRDIVDSRCQFITELPKVVFKPKRNATKGKDGAKRPDLKTEDLHNGTDAESNATQSGDLTSRPEGAEETESLEENEVEGQPLGKTDPDQPDQSKLRANVERSSVESGKHEESKKHEEL